MAYCDKCGVMTYLTEQGHCCDAPLCSASFAGYRCSLATGHDGQHVATAGVMGEVARWGAPSEPHERTCGLPRIDVSVPPPSGVKPPRKEARQLLSEAHEGGDKPRRQPGDVRTIAAVVGVWKNRSDYAIVDLWMADEKRSRVFSVPLGELRALLTATRESAQAGADDRLAVAEELIRDLREAVETTLYVRERVSARPDIAVDQLTRIDAFLSAPAPMRRPAPLSGERTRELLKECDLADELNLVGRVMASPAHGVTWGELRALLTAQSAPAPMRRPARPAVIEGGTLETLQRCLVALEDVMAHLPPNDEISDPDGARWVGDLTIYRVLEAGGELRQLLDAIAPASERDAGEETK